MANVLVKPVLWEGRFDNAAIPTETLDPLDPFVQMESLRRLQDGWLDGEGKAPSEAGLDWMAQQLDLHLSGRTTPYLYPTLEGGVRAEWTLGRWEVSLDVDLVRKTGYWHALCMDSATWDAAEEEKSLKLSRHDDWQWIADRLLSKEMV